ncbi:MAG: ZIP family metal transporter [Thermoanaerobaculia bacterium]
MHSVEPVIVVLLMSCLAAAMAAVGVLPFRFGRPHQGWIGGAYALASGLMLGAGYLLMGRGLDEGALPAVAGVVIGIGYSHSIRYFAGLEALDDEAAKGRSEYGYKLILQSVLHSAAEGVAIGVAMVVELKLGVFVALALAIHNIGEGMVLADQLSPHRARLRQAAALAVACKVSQPLLALAAFALSPVLTGFLPSALGFAAGALVLLVLTELLPNSYHRSPAVSVALIVGVSAGAVVLLESLLI